MRNKNILQENIEKTRQPSKIKNKITTGKTRTLHKNKVPCQNKREGKNTKKKRRRKKKKL